MVKGILFEQLFPVYWLEHRHHVVFLITSELWAVHPQEGSQRTPCCISLLNRSNSQCPATEGIRNLRSEKVKKKSLSLLTRRERWNFNLFQSFKKHQKLVHDLGNIYNTWHFYKTCTILLQYSHNIFTTFLQYFYNTFTVLLQYFYNIFTTLWQY